MKILNVVAGTPEWDAVRAQHNCASEAPVMMGASKHMGREELVRIKATGGVKEFSDFVRERVLDKGHAVEALARPIVEEMIGQDLYPATVTDDDSYLLASLDGGTMDGTILFEHKQWNEDLAAQVRNKDLDPMYYWQLEQQLAVATDAEKVIFVTSDGTRDNFEAMEYTRVPGRAEKLMAGWKQFDLDVAAYEHVEVLPKPAATVIEALPALLVQIEGKVLASNLDKYEAAAGALIKSINTDLTTDQHFVDAAEAVKFCKDGEDRLALVKAQAIAQTESIEKLFATIDKISEQLRSKRLELDKLVTARKETIRADIVRGGQVAFAAHMEALNDQLGKPYMPAIKTDFAGAVKGKRELTSMRGAVATELARAKIEANEVAGKIGKNLTFLRENAQEHKALFADVATIVLKDPEDLQTLVKARIDQFKADEAKKEAETRERIRAEEQAKAEKDAREKLAREQAAAAPAPTPAPTAAPTPVAAPAAAAPATVVPMRAPAPTSPPTLKLGDINARIAPLSIDAAGLAALGFATVLKTKGACLFHESDFPRMVDSMVAQLRKAQQEQQAA